MGPRVEDSAIIYSEIASMQDLPQGYGDAQSAGEYRIAKQDHENYFEYNLGPHSWKQFLFPPKVTLASATRDQDGWTFESHNSDVPTPQKFAFLGVRACELAAIAIQDRVFMEGPYADPIYRKRRESVFVIAVNCTVAASTCFCTSMGTGPKCEPIDGRKTFDLALTELNDGFIVEVASPQGQLAVEALNTTVPSEDLRTEKAAKELQASAQIERRFDTTDIRDLLLTNLDHPHWDDVATRCLSCTNCTMVCPTCFCSTVTEVSDLSGDKVERQRQWDSCFNVDFGYTASGVVRNDRRSRFRQWLTHKLASWHDQFDTSGCVGCGRCITWCPVGIDLTEEVAAIRSQPSSNRTLPVIQPDANLVCAVKELEE